MDGPTDTQTDRQTECQTETHKQGKSVENHDLIKNTEYVDVEKHSEPTPQDRGRIAGE